eukprot:7616649-Pyramimonas_sp.AAC.2
MELRTGHDHSRRGGVQIRVSMTADDLRRELICVSATRTVRTYGDMLQNPMVGRAGPQSVLCNHARM